VSVEFKIQPHMYGNSLTHLRENASPADVAREFEAIFIGYTLKVMRESVSSSGLFEDSPGKDIYMEMMDQEIARAIASRKGFGLADQIRRSLEREAPVEPADFRVTSEVGWRTDPLTGQRRFHQGVDLAAPEGTPVPAFLAGKVVFSGWRNGYGNTVIIQNKEGFRTLYAHLSEVSVREGEEVAGNQAVGRVGSTGRSTGPHLHFEVERDGRLFDPLQVIRNYRQAESPKVSGGTVDMLSGTKG
jgi:murein DD-endopeptidase MepM/ murein hydrolase activator NlpD